MSAFLNTFYRGRDFLFFRSPLRTLVKPEERQLTLLMAVLAFCILGIPQVFTGVAAQTMFLNRYGAEVLPWVYISLAVTIPCTGWLYQNLKARFSFHRVLMIWIGVLSVAPLVLLYLLLDVLGKWPTFAALVWFEVQWVLGNMVFWEFSRQIFHVGQAKRLYGLIGTGEVVALTVGGLLMFGLVKLIDTPYLLLFSAVGAIAGARLAWYLLNNHVDLSGSISKRTATSSKPSKESMHRDPYVRWIFVTMTFSMLIYYFVDMAFYEQAQTQFAYPPELAGFLGMFMAVIGFSTLILRTLLVGVSLKWLGVIGSIGVLPLLVLLAAGGVAGAGFFQREAALIFWLMCGTRFIEWVFRQSLFRAASGQLYLPFFSQDRQRIQNLSENMVGRIAGGAAGVLLLGIQELLNPTAVELAALICGIAVGWMACIVMLRKHYLLTLQNAMLNRSLLAMPPDLLTNDTVVKKILEQASATEVIYILRSLEQLSPDNLNEYFERYLHSEHEDVRGEVVRIIRDNSIKTMLIPVAELLDRETSPTVKGTILQTLPLIDTSSDLTLFNRVLSHLKDDDLEVRKGALLGMLQGGGLPGAVASGEFLDTLIKSPKIADRKFACEILESAAMPSYYHALVELLRDPNPIVGKAALRATSVLKNENLWPLVLEALSVRSLRYPAIKTLVIGGDGAFFVVERGLNDPNQSRFVAGSLAKVCGALTSKASYKLLIEHFEYSDQQVRHEIYRALSQRDYHAPRSQRPNVLNTIEVELEMATRAYAAIHDLEDYPGADLLVAALRDEIRDNIDRVFLLLSFIYPPEDVLQIRHNLESRLTEKHWNGLKTLEKLVPKNLKVRMFPLLERNLSDYNRLQQMKNFYRMDSLSRERRLRKILSREDKWISPWTKTCALQVAGSLKYSTLSDLITEELYAEDPVQRETAIWALSQCKPQVLAEYVVPMLQDPAEIVSNRARFVLESVTMMGYLRAPEYTYPVTANETNLFTEILFDDQEPLSRRLRAAQMLGSLANSNQHDLLLDALQLPNATIRAQIFRGLSSNPTGISEELRERMLVLIPVETQDIHQTIAAYRDLSPKKEFQRLVKAFDDELNQNRIRLFALLQILQGNRELAPYEHKVIHDPTASFSKKHKDHIRSLIQPYRHQDGYPWLESVLTELNNKTLVNRMNDLLPESVSDQEWLRRIAFDPRYEASSWTRVQGLYCIFECDIHEFSDNVARLLEHNDPLIRETAVWGLHQLAPEKFYERAGQLLDDPNRQIVDLIMTLLQANKNTMEPSASV